MNDTQNPPSPTRSTLAVAEVLDGLPTLFPQMSDDDFTRLRLLVLTEDSTRLDTAIVSTVEAIVAKVETVDASALATLTFPSSEWDNGYFFDTTPSAATTTDGSPVSLALLDALVFEFDAHTFTPSTKNSPPDLSTMFADYSALVAVGAGSVVVVDLRAKSVEHNPYPN